VKQALAVAVTVAAATGLLLAGPVAPAAPALADTSGHFLQVAWSTKAGWQPAESEWIGSGQAVQVILNPDGGLPNEPGGAEQVHIAVRSTAADPAELYLALVDPDPEGGREISPGHFAELFDQLQVTVAEQGQVKVSAPAPSITSLPLGDLAPNRAARVFDLTISLPDSIDNRWLEARTGFTLILSAAGQEASPKLPPQGPKVPTGGHVFIPTGLGLSLLAAGAGLLLILIGLTLIMTYVWRRTHGRPFD
jgi:hypothetical protein